MKATLVSILQQKMDKCTTEQFWAVAVITGLNGFLISQNSVIKSAIPGLAIVIAVTILTGYGIFYVIHRHESYYSFRSEQVEFLKDEIDIPPSLKWKPESLRKSCFTGVVFYVGWILTGWLATLTTYL